MDIEKKDRQYTWLPPSAPSLCPLPLPLLQPPTLFPILARTQLALQKFFNHIGTLTSAEVSNKALERELPGTELHSHPGLPCVGGSITQGLRQGAVWDWDGGGGGENQMS